jgi:DNA-binding NarL/FixJ family response regulator
VKCLVIDDDWLVRGGIAQALKAVHPACRVIDAASLLEAFSVLAEADPVDLIILDLNLGESKGVATLKELRAWCEERDLFARIVVVSAAGNDDPALVREVIENYGTGFVVKGTPEKLFQHALSLTLDGGIFIPDAILRALGGPTGSPASRGGAESTRVAKLTERECQIAALLVQGMTYKKIAIELGKVEKNVMAESTVRTHVGNIAWKLGVTENAKAGVMAEIARRGLTFQAKR